MGVSPFLLRAVIQSPGLEETSLMDFQIRARAAVINPPEQRIIWHGNVHISCALMKTLSSQIQEEEEKLD